MHKGYLKIKKIIYRTPESCEKIPKFKAPDGMATHVPLRHNTYCISNLQLYEVLMNNVCPITGICRTLITGDNVGQLELNQN